MDSYVDRTAGFAAFRQGRSLCVRLDGRLDDRMARGAASRIRDDQDSIRLRLECSTLDRVDAGALQRLAHAILAWSRSRPDRSVDLLNLQPALLRQTAWRAAWHPLHPFLDPDELVFIDPDRDEVWEATPSRH